MATNDILYRQSVDEYLAGNLAKASNICQKILQKNQKDDKTLNLFALIQSANGKIDQAILYFEKAIRANPKNSEALTNLANAYQSKKQYEKAIDTYEKAIEVNPKFSKSYYNAAILLKELGNIEQAKELLKKAISLEPNFVDPYTNLAAIYKSENDLDEALAALKDAPKDERVLSSRALILSEKKEHEEALRQINMAIELKPNHEMLNNLGIVLSSAKRHEEAIYAYLQAVAMKNDFDTAYSNMANSFLELKDEQKAKGALFKAISLNPNSASSYVNLGFYLKKIGDISGAKESFTKALEIDPKNRPAATNLGILLMFTGNLRNGFALYENRAKPLIKSSSPEWMGEVLDGKQLFIYHEQGFGDTLNFARLLLNHRFYGHDVIFMPQKELFSIFYESSLPIKIASQDDALQDGFDFDFHVSLMSLPYLLDITQDNIPNNINYINIDKTRKAFFQSKLSNNTKKIGIVWQGNKDYSGDADRSVSLHFFDRFLSAGYTIVSLQKELNKAQFDEFANGKEAFEFASELNSFSDTAALISSLDCVVSVDTSVAHLAGVLGIRTFILLPFIPDWRWGSESDYSAWYDSVTLCRQIERRNWNDAFEVAFKGVQTFLG
jgi:hypothetical protein